MRFTIAIVALVSVAQAFTTGSGFAPALSSGYSGISQASRSNRGVSSLQMAHFVHNKGAKKSVKNRPKKASLSDINRKAPSYDVDPMIAARQTTPEYSVIGKADMSSMFKVEKECGKVFYHTKAPHAS